MRQSKEYSLDSLVLLALILFVWLSSGGDQDEVGIKDQPAKQCLEKGDPKTIENATKKSKHNPDPKLVVLACRDKNG